MMQTERRFIGRTEAKEFCASISRLYAEPRRRLLVVRALLSREREADNAIADAKLRTILQHRGSHTFLFEERAVSGVQVLQVRIIVVHFQQTVVARNFLIVQDDARALASQNHPRLSQIVHRALSGPGY